MKLKSMEITAEEQKEKAEKYSGPELASPSSYSSRYPYGLELRLDNDTLEKLDVDTLPKVGKRIRIEAIAVVTGAHINESRRGKTTEKNKSLELQIQKLAISGDPQSAEDAVDDALEDME